MSIAIGGQSLETAVPADLNDRLVKATGCGVAEYVAILKGRGVTAFQVARALQPMLAATMPVPALAKLIAVADLSAVRRDVAKLLGSAASAPVASVAPAPIVAPAPAQEVAHGDTA